MKKTVAALSLLFLVFFFQNCNSFEVAKPEESSSTAADESDFPPTVTPPPTPTTPTSPNPNGTTVVQNILRDGLNQTSQAAHFVTFGQAFAQGDFLTSQQLNAVVNGQTLPLQVDSKVVREGSVTHAVLTLDISSLNNTFPQNINLQTTSLAPAATTNLLMHNLLESLNVEMQLTLLGTTYHQNIRNIIHQAINENRYKTWLTGSLVSEVSVTEDLTPYLNVIYDVRIYKNKQYKVDITLSNDWGYKTGMSTQNYNIKIVRDGKTVDEKNIVHHPFANWRQTINSENFRNGIFIENDLSYLGRIGAVPNYDRTVVISTSAYKRLIDDGATVTPLGSGPLDKYMPNVGWRFDIGPETNWTAIYLLKQDWQSRQAILNIGNVSGSVPWHYRDPATREPFTLDQKPTFWMDGRCSRACNSADVPPDDSYTISSGWTIDTSHQPSLSYVPYLITGDHYYLRELKAHAGYNYFLAWNEHRQNGRGLLIGTPGEQTRGGAWLLRTALNIAYIIPNNDPLHSYFVGRALENLNHLKTSHVDNAVLNSKNNHGYFLSYDTEDGNRIAPWQEDFNVMILGIAARRKLAHAREILLWKTNFTLGRFQQTDSVLCATQAPGYWWLLGRSSWSELGELNNLNSPCPANFPVDSYPDFAGGYVAEAVASLNSLKAFGASGIDPVLNFIQSKAPGLRNDYSNHPVFAIAP